MKKPMKRSIPSNQRASTDRQSHEPVTCEVLCHIGALGEGMRGWTREVNLVSWNGKQAGLDIRSWSEDHQKMSKGVNLNLQEAENLKTLLSDFQFDEVDLQPEPEALPFPI